MPHRFPRSPVRMPGTRQCRLARRLAAGLSPAEIKRLDTATDEEIEAFVTDRDLSRLVQQYTAVRGLPWPERHAALFETAWQELWNLIDIGDRRASLFVVYQANRGRHPVRHLVKLVVDRLDAARRPFEKRDTPLPAGSSPETMQGYGQHPLGPAQAAVTQLVDFLPAQTGEAILIQAETSGTEAPVEEPVEPVEEIQPGNAGDPASADDPQADLVASARANPAMAAWLIKRFEAKLAELQAGHTERGTLPGQHEKLQPRRTRAP